MYVGRSGPGQECRLGAGFSADRRPGLSDRKTSSRQAFGFILSFGTPLAPVLGAVRSRGTGMPVAPAAAACLPSLSLLPCVYIPIRLDHHHYHHLSTTADPQSFSATPTPSPHGRQHARRRLGQPGPPSSLLPGLIAASPSKPTCASWLPPFIRPIHSRFVRRSLVVARLEHTSAMSPPAPLGVAWNPRPWRHGPTPRRAHTFHCADCHARPSPHQDSAQLSSSNHLVVVVVVVVVVFASVHYAAT
jgi:hypothetical protein